MSFGQTQAVVWSLAYVALAIAPVAVAYAGPIPAARSLWTEVAIGLGFVGLSMLALQFVLTGRFAGVARSFGLDSMLQFHRQAGLFAFGFILAHPLILFAADTGNLSFLDPRVNAIRALALSAVLTALILLTVSTLWRQSLRIPYEWWQPMHGLLALFVVFVGLVHILQVGGYVSTWWKQALWVGITATAFGLLFNTRILRPYRRRQGPYRITEIKDESADTWTLMLEPKEHSGMAFEPGQFAWLTVSESPFSFQQHPFSFSSSAEHPERLSFTIKALGDFTGSVGTIKEGAKAFIEGPYGALVPAKDPAEGAVLIAGGIGITPFISMLRTFVDRGDSRPLLLIYANRDWESALFKSELASMVTRLNLEIVHTLELPPDGWTGERGRVTPELLDRHLPAEAACNREYFICGPPAMMNLVELELHRRGVRLQQQHSERFNIV